MLTGPAACLCWGSESGCCSSLSKQEGQLGDIPLPGLASLCVLLFLLCYTQEERFAFLAEWYDPSAALLRRYQLLYYPKDGAVEMVRCSDCRLWHPAMFEICLTSQESFCHLQFDMKNQRTFLRRTKYDDLHSEDLFVGNRVNVFSRQLNLIGYGDQYTANKMGSRKERYFPMWDQMWDFSVCSLHQTIERLHKIWNITLVCKLTWSFWS